MSRDKDMGNQARVNAAACGSAALLNAMFASFREHARTSKRPLEHVAVFLMNGVMP